ncbi:MAG TPA: hypothetical protein VN924_22780 [Bryobacteraceae bacterium]|jgi:hypothetical protein|nr:hypothetical protein [Bryobacteraceae bacterium]
MNRIEMKGRICLWIALPAIVTTMTMAAPEDRTVEIAKDMMRAMGGEAAWKQARYVRFDFTFQFRGRVITARAYLWDKQTGRARLEDKSAEGKFSVVLFNSRDPKGAAYMTGKKLEGQDAAADLKGAARTLSLDSDWLALPWNLLSPGFHLKYAGEKSLNGQVFDVVEVAVDSRAGGPAMRYSAYVSRQSHLMEYCSVGTEASLWDWKYTTAGGVQLAGEHHNPDKKAAISMGNVKVLDKVDDAFFTDPARGLTALQ